MSFSYVKFNICMFRWYRFYVSEEGEPGKISSCGEGTAASALLRSGDARQSFSCGEGVPGGDSLADFGGSEREGDPLRIAPVGI
jgi:hypothetical protein